MATISVNTANNIEFVNIVGGENAQEAPTLTIQVGDWKNGQAVESGVVFDVTGDQAPLLTANDVRKLSKWLARAAESLDGVKEQRKKSRARNNRDHEEDEFDNY